MRELTFDVIKQKLVPTSDNSDIVLGTKGYLVVKVNFEGIDWNGCKVVVKFSYGTYEECVGLKNGVANVPNSAAALKSFKISLVGRKTDIDYEIVTNSVIINQTE